jgi:putative ABC transport system permease protein
MFGKLPTAWLQLTYQKVKLAVAICGIAFIVVLVFIQLGFRESLFDSSVRIHQALKADIFIIGARSPSLIALSSFSRRRLYQALAFPQVESISGVYTGLAKWRSPSERTLWRNIFVIGFNVNDNIINLPGLEENLDKLKKPDVVLFDRSSRREFGTIVQDFENLGNISTQIRSSGPDDRRIQVQGLFNLGTSFGIDGTILTSDLNFRRIFSNRPEGFIDIGLVSLKPGANLQQTLMEMRQVLPKDVVVLSRAEFVKQEKMYWQNSTNIGFIFTIGLLGALLVGVVIVYQILYSNIVDSMAEYATLKAMGYRHTYLLGVVFQEAFILALLGYLPGFFAALSVYNFSRKATGLPISMDIQRALSVFTLTLVLSFVSGAITVQKLRQADPADIF